MSADAELAALGYDGYVHGEPGDGGASLRICDGLLFEMHDWYEVVEEDDGGFSSAPIPQGRMASINRKQFFQWGSDVSATEMHATLLDSAEALYGGILDAVRAAKEALSVTEASDASV